jgi:glycosyltransferase involved in cell wall biosynthesis
MDPSLSGTPKLLYGAIENLLARFATDAVILGSKQELEAALEMGLPMDKMQIIVNGIAEPELESRQTVRARLGLSEQEICLGFVGRLTHQKAPERLIQALAELPDRNVKAVMLGDGDQKTAIEALISDLRLDGRVIVRSGLDGQAHMPAFDLLVVPSRYESMGYVFLEAAAAGIPIVSTNVGIASDVIRDGANGFIVPNTDDAQVWSNHLTKALTSEVYSSLSEQAKTRTRIFGIQRMTEETIELYTRALARRGKKQRVYGGS